ncbi:nucleotide disphospho-sugar-binding domain-containing protein [Amycolatopsis sp. cg5]|uniref:nucleotide disphospho-sugar-binding domain-containing protein n=1 Tax=Amycolatopsis sp. cg5 TaxID=3238802 RepID=UPI003524C042
MRVLLNAMVPSHLLPMVPLTWALRAAGHEVVFFGHEDTVRAAHAAGLPTRQVESEAGSVSRWRPPGTVKSAYSAAGSSTKLPTAEEERTAAIGRRWKARLEVFVDEYVAFAKAWRPDVIITDPMEFSGLVVAGVLDVPGVVHRWGFDNLTSTLVEPSKQALAETCHRLGSAGVPDAALVIDPCPPTVQSPNLAPAQPVRFVPYNGTAAVPDWTVQPGTGLICISFGVWGTETLAKEGQLRAVVDSVGRAVAELAETEAVLVVPQQYHAELGALPDRVVVVDQLPINHVMPRCALMIHHGGSGSALTSYAYGVPQLVVAQEGPMLIPTAERIADSGAGLALISEEDRRDTGLLTGAIIDLLKEPSYRQAAERVRAEMLAQPAPGEVAALVANLA